VRIRILIPLWKRPEVTRFCFEGVKRLQKESRHQIDVSCVLSEEEFIDTCSEFGFDWHFAPNNPLGQKMNIGIASTLKYDYDYLMIMNSDNVVESELIDRVYEPFFESLNPYFGIGKVTYVNFYTHEAKEVTYSLTILGIAKMIHRSVLKKSTKLYRPELNRCLDNTMMDVMIALGISPTFVDYEGMLAMDFKSEVNIWTWEQFANKGKTVCYKPKLEEAN